MSEGVMGNEGKGIVEAVEIVVKSLVTHTDEIDIKRAEGVVLVDINEADRGRLIGRQGRTIQALRTIVTAGANALGEEGPAPRVEIEEPERR
jgi:hypothetical protein